MKPFTIILGILLGSLAAIAFGLGVVALVFALIQDDSGRLASETPSLLESTGIFTLLAVICAAAFFGTLRRRSWRFAVLAILWLGLLLTGRHYWPY